MKKEIAFVTGGYSGEAQVSYKSAETIYANFNRDKYNVYKIDITPEGWWYRPDHGEVVQVDRSTFTLLLNDKRVSFDAAFIGIHGTPGEDGKLQGYFDMLGISYQTCDATTSALTFNKRYTVAVAAFAGIPVAKSVHLFKNEALNYTDILNQTALPVFVKPNNGGSSIGMSKVSDAADLPEAIQKAFQEDDQVLVESFVKGREFTIGVFKSKGDIIALPMTEIIPKKEFFDFEAKYTPGVTDEITPADAPEEVHKLIADTARKVYRAFNCAGAVRIDFIYNADENKAYMLEINTVPGQTFNSLLPQQVRAFGMSLPDFYDLLIDEMLSNS